MRQGKPWTAKEHKLLRKLYAITPYEKLARIFRRSAIAVKSRAKVLGLTRSNRKYWSTAENAELRRLYPHSQNSKSLARRFACTLSQLYGQAHRLDISKTPETQLAIARLCGQNFAVTGRTYRYPKGHVPANKGLRRPGYAPGRMRETQFKKGNRPQTWVPVGTVIMNTDGYLKRKIADEPESIAGKGAQSTNWEYIHKRVWEDAHGPIPPGHRIWWKDGDHRNCAIENLELLSDKEHMARTTIHNLPAPLKEVILLKGAINRQITVKTRKLNARKKQAVRSPRPPVRDPGSAQGQRRAAGR